LGFFLPWEWRGRPEQQRKVGVCSSGRKAGSFEYRMHKHTPHTHTLTHSMPFSVNKGLMDHNKALLMVPEATSHLAHTHIHARNFFAGTCLSESLLCYIHTRTNTHTHTLSQTHTQGPSSHLLFQPHATSNAHSHTGEALCARGRNNCGSSCTVTFDP